MRGSLRTSAEPASGVLHELGAGELGFLDREVRRGRCALLDPAHPKKSRERGEDEEEAEAHKEADPEPLPDVEQVVKNPPTRLEEVDQREYDHHAGRDGNRDAL